MANHTSWYKKSAKMGKLTRAGFYRFYFFELFYNFYTYFIVHQILALTRGQNIQIQKVNHQVKFSSCCVLDWHIQIESRMRPLDRFSVIFIEFGNFTLKRLVLIHQSLLQQFLAWFGSYVSIIYMH